MAWIIKKTRRTRGPRALSHDELNALIAEHEREYIAHLTDMWERQQRRITDEDIARMFEEGGIGPEQMAMFAEDYGAFSIAVNLPTMTTAMGAGAGEILIGEAAAVYASAPHAWAQTHAARLVRDITQAQREALKGLVAEAVRTGHTAHELGKQIRQAVGLTERQAIANQRYYLSSLKQLTEQHPRTKREVLEQRALASADRYAKRQLNQRAKAIAITEMATSYNMGKHEATRDAMARGVYGRMDKRWNTALDERVCETCGAMHGVRVGFDELFILPDGQEILIPPAHPKCRCVVDYVEAEPAAGATEGMLGIDADEIDAFRQQLIDDPEAALARLGEIQYNREAEAFRQSIRDGTQNLTVLKKQEEHMLGSRTYKPGNSYIYGSIEDAQQLVNQHASTGIFDQDGNGKFSKKEIVMADRIIGVAVDRDGNKHETRAFKIHYRKTGVHIAPRKESGK